MESLCSLTSGNSTVLIQADSCAFVLWLVSVSDLPPLVVQLSYGCSSCPLKHSYTSGVSAASSVSNCFVDSASSISAATTSVTTF